MILQLRNNKIIVKNPYTPENISNTKVSYIFELNTNQYRPVLYIGSDVYDGYISYVDFSKCTEPAITLKVDLIDNIGRVMYTYEETFNMYKSFSLCTNEQINVYDELIQARETIHELEERGEVI